MSNIRVDADSQIRLVLWLQLVLINVGSTRILGVAFFLVPITIGVLMFFYRLRYLRIHRDTLSLFFSILLFAFIFRSTVNGLVFTIEFFKDLVIILYNYAMVRLFQSYKLTTKEYLFIVALLLFTSIYYLVGRLFGANPLILTQYIFPGSSYHLVAWYGLVLVSFVIFSFGPGYKSVLVLFLYLVLCFVLGGRTGVFISLFVFVIGTVVLGNGKFRFISISIGVVFSVFLYFIMDTGGVGWFKDVYERGTSLGPREFIWGCYIDHLNIERFILGFDKVDIAACTTQVISRNTVESSLFNLQIITGVFSVVLLSIILLKIFASMRESILFFGVLSAYLFRISTGEYVFVTVFDWLMLVFIFYNYGGASLYEKDNLRFR